MVHSQLLWSDEPVTVIQSDGVDADKVKERYTKHPAVVEEKTHGNHAKWHVDICQEVNPDDAVTVVVGICDGRSRDNAHSPILHTNDQASTVWVPTLLEVHRTSKSSYSISLP